jgi:hypothetical protein
MKKIGLALICLLFARVASAQKELLSFNEQNKYTYFQVVALPGLTVDTLQNRALYFLKTAYPQAKVKQGDTTAITGTDKFVVYDGISLTRHQAGEIHFTLNILYKDQKYKYWLTDFVFTPYKLDRYGNYVTDMGEIPLEKGLAKLDKKPLDSYLDQTGTFCKNFGDKLKKYMLNISALPPKEVKKKVISTKDW